MNVRRLGRTSIATIVVLCVGLLQPSVASAAVGSPTSRAALWPLPVLADLSVAKMGSPDRVHEESDLTYDITVTNAGPDSATGATLADQVPSGTTFVSFSQTAGPAFALSVPNVGGTGLITATAVTFGVGTAAFRLIVHVTAKPGATITNTATVASATADPNPYNNRATATNTVLAAADLSVTKCDAPDPVTAGENITYTIGAANAGPSEARNVWITDQIPANTTFVSFTQNSGPAFTLTTPPAGGSGSVTAMRATFAAGASATFTLVVKVNANTPDGTVISNTATISSDTCEVNPDNNSATATTHVKAPTPSADLSVSKSGSPDIVQAGSNITYMIVIANAGPSDAQNVSLNDATPANTTFVSFTQTAGPAFVLTSPPSGGTGPVTATAASFANGASATFQLVVNVNLGTPDGTIISNTATVSSSTSDSNAANNSATVTTGVGGFGT